jgi:hypothetical protein
MKNGDISLVKEIADIKNINFFSFATKYCCYHNMYVYDKDDYYIFDNMVKQNLHHYEKNIKTSQLDAIRKEKNYEKFKEIMDKCLDEHSITLANKRRLFDHFL